MSDSPAADRPRVLLLQPDPAAMGNVVACLEERFDVHGVQTAAEASEALQEGSWEAVIAALEGRLEVGQSLGEVQAAAVLNAIGEGVCLVDAKRGVVWANRRMQSFGHEAADQVRRVARQAQAAFELQAARGLDSDAIHSKRYNFSLPDRAYEAIVSPVVGQSTKVERVVAIVYDATASKRMQGKIDAIDSSGRELARIDAEAVADFSPQERLKLLQDKIIRYSKDLMHFDHFAIRVLDRRSGKLEVVIAQGLPPEALEIDLYAQPEGNGISGFVAATGRSYVCHDTEKDSRYVMGLTHGKSSLTVPLMLYDEVVGVYNVESEDVGAFNEDDRQFCEIFGRHVALALNILDLLRVERSTISGQLSDTVIRQLENPLNALVSEIDDLRGAGTGNGEVDRRLDRVSQHIRSIRGTLDEVAAGPSTVRGGGRVEEESDDPLLHGKRVLVADDEANMRKTLSEVLRKHGCDVQTVKDGYEACTLLDAERFDLVISDIRMPYRNGYEVFEAAKRTTHHPPVILMTGFGWDPHHSIVRASKQGLESVLFKPFEVETLLEELHKALGPEAEAGIETEQEAVAAT